MPIVSCASWLANYRVALRRKWGDMKRALLLAFVCVLVMRARAASYYVSSPDWAANRTMSSALPAAKDLERFSRPQVQRRTCDADWRTSHGLEVEGDA